MEDVYGELKQIINGDVALDEETLKAYSSDASLFRVMPKAVVFPKDVDDIKALVRFVADKKSANPELSLTVRSGGSDMSGGPLNDSIIVDVNKYINHFKEVVHDKRFSDGGGYATAQPGMFYRDFEKKTLAEHLLMPSYPASREISTIGGMVANNAGGEKTLKYGKTEDYVLQLKMVLRDGNEYVFRSLNKSELDAKMKLKTVEGEIYSELYKLISENNAILKKAKPKVSKNSAGYYLWNVWNGDKQIFDIPKLIVGSQGTFGIITEITFRLIKPKEHSTLLVILLKDLDKLADVVLRVLEYKPESFESYDDHTLRVALKFLPDMIKLLGAKNLISLGLQFLPEFWMVITGGVPKLFLEAEFTGDSESEIYEKARAAQSGLKEFGVKTRIAKSDKEEQKYWTVRRESFNLLRHHVKGKQTAPFIDDIIVRPEKLPEFLPKLTDIMNNYDLIYTIAGHIGYGNLHIIPLMDI